jgi:hypothetical protein
LTTPGGNLVRGITGWTKRVTTAGEIKAWAKEPALSLSIQCRTIRAFDIDCEARGEEFAMVIETELGFSLPTRMRSNTGKRLLAFRLEGEHRKQVIRTNDGAIELLADGQQFVACGTHTSGVRYEWVDGNPDEFPLLTEEQFQRVMSVMRSGYEIEAPAKAAKGRQATLSKVAKQDPVANHLRENDWVLTTRPDGSFNIRCPNADQHTGESSDSATVYFLPHTNGYATGQFKCEHAHCQALTHGDFLELCGFTGSQFEVIDAAEPEMSTEPGAIAVAYKPVFLRRRANGTVIPDIKNIRLSLHHTQPTKAAIVFDAFTRGELIGWDAGAWDD